MSSPVSSGKRTWLKMIGAVAVAGIVVAGYFFESPLKPALDAQALTA